MGVLYQPGDDMRQLLVPFARAHGSGLEDKEIHGAYLRAMLGELTTSELWNALGVVGDAGDLDRTYLEGYHLVPGIPGLLDQLLQQGLELGCISNDIAKWSLTRRRSLDLDRRIRHWTISSEARVRKPNEGIYRAFLASSGLPPDAVVFIDDRAVNLEAAAVLGFQTILVDFAGLGHDPMVPRTVEQLRRTLDSMSARNG